MIKDIQYSRTQLINERKMVWLQFEVEKTGLIYTMDFKVSDHKLISTSIYKRNENQTDREYTTQLLRYQQEILKTQEAKDIISKELGIDSTCTVSCFTRSMPNKHQRFEEKYHTMANLIVKEVIDRKQVYGCFFEDQMYHTFLVDIGDVYNGTLKKVLKPYQKKLLSLLEEHPDKMRWILN